MYIISTSFYWVSWWKSNCYSQGQWNWFTLTRLLAFFYFQLIVADVFHLNSHLFNLNEISMAFSSICHQFCKNVPFYCLFVSSMTEVITFFPFTRMFSVHIKLTNNKINSMPLYMRLSTHSIVSVNSIPVFSN